MHLNEIVVPLVNWYQEHKRQLPWSCLLYTSDAADEL